MCKSMKTMKKTDYLSSAAMDALQAVEESRRIYKDQIEETSRMYKSQIEEMKHAAMADYQESLVLEEIKEAAEHGVLGMVKNETISSLLESYKEASELQSTLQMLGDSLPGAVKPEYYLEPSTSGFLADTNISWLRDANAWSVEKSLLAGLDIDQISGVPSRYEELCRLEQEISQLEKIPSAITSATAQIASITEAMGEKSSLEEGWETLSHLLDDYCDLASKQYAQILGTADEKETEWRLGVVEAASRYVDRQITWSFQLSDFVAEEDITESPEGVETEGSALPLIPSYIGYTRRVNKTPVEGLEESAITRLSEKGKRITDQIIAINRLQLDKGKDRIFELSETLVQGMLGMSQLVCNTADKLGALIDTLYFAFYENLKHIKILIGHGDEEVGDRMVREDEEYQCIFDVKTIRSDLRHDLDHGGEKEYKKKMKNIGDCYKKYCGNRPLKERDFRMLQEGIYDKVLQLEEILIQMSCTEA